MSVFRHRLTRLTLLLGFAFLSSPSSGSAASRSEGPKTEFNRDIRPLFAKHCTACHGGVKAAGKISFLYRDKALAAGKSGQRAIVPGNPDDSELMRRVLSKDPDELMPQPNHGPRLSDAEVATLHQWIQEGAQWSEHWSFVPPQEPTPPKIKNTRWPKASLDRFILQRLEAEGLKPSRDATPAEWLRRVSLDLTGIPPTPTEFELFRKAFSNDPKKAKESVIDQLLASKRFGERWASMWLDLARYSDTFGFEKDPHRDIWPWRDWVVNAFNSNLPFDQFTIRQLAGDLLPSPSADDLLATAFHRNTQNNTEGGTDDEEYRTVAVLDRVNTTWTAWQATTFGCTQCHSHPYDPFPQKDYYRFAAFFDNTEDCDQNDDFPRHLFPNDPAKRDESTRLQLESKRTREQLNSAGLASANQVRNWSAAIPIHASASGGNLSIDDKGQINASGTLPVSVKYTVHLPAPDGLTAFRIDILPESDHPKRAPERGQVFSKITASLSVPGSSNQVVKLKEVIADYLAGPRDPQRVLEGDGGFGSYPVMTAPRNGIIVLERPLTAPPGSHLELVIEHGIASNSGFQGCQLKHFRFTTTTDTALTDLVNSPERAQAWSHWRSLREQLKGSQGTSVPVLAERPDAARRETRVFIRGNRMSRDEVVTPGIPDVVQPPKSEGPLNRLDMAKWLVSDRNPLAARVLANRLWAEMFGHGIVETLEDFGTSGAKPTHPELLDHLALRLRGELRWSIKSFVREIALSATYGQSARTTPKWLEKDPANRLYARGPRSRLTAEMIRDQALSVAGLLSDKSAGPPVYPPQPDGVWSTVYSGEKWDTSKGEDRFRRALYTYSRRTSGYPMFLTFDAPTRDSCTARRQPSNTPLQALTIMNDDAFIEMAKALAQRMNSNGGSPRQKIEQGCRLITLEKPSRAVITTLTQLHQRSLTDYSKDPDTSSKLGSTPELSALTLVANTLLNLDLSLTR